MPRGTWMVGCLAVLVAVAAAQAETVTLKARYEPGMYVMTTKVDMDNTSTMSGPAGPEGMNQKIQIMMVAEMEVGQRDADGTLPILLTFIKRVAQSLEGGGMAMAYDSAEPSAPATDAGRRPVPHARTPGDGQDGRQQQGRLGVRHERGLGCRGDREPRHGGDGQRHEGTVRQQLRDPDGGLGRQHDAAGPVAIGDSWDADRTETIPMLGTLQVKQKCTLKEIKSTPAGKVAVIAFTSTIEKSPGRTAETAPATAMTIGNIKIAQTGTMEMLVDSGMPLSHVADQKMSMDMTMKPPARRGGSGPSR